MVLQTDSAASADAISAAMMQSSRRILTTTITTVGNFSNAGQSSVVSLYFSPATLQLLRPPRAGAFTASGLVAAHLRRLSCRTAFDGQDSLIFSVLGSTIISDSKDLRSRGATKRD